MTSTLLTAYALGLLGPIGGPELMIILLIALLMFGGRLPDVARSIGKSVNQFKRGLKDLDQEIQKEEAPVVPPRAAPALPSSTIAPPSMASTAAVVDRRESSDSGRATAPTESSGGGGSAAAT